MTITVFLVHFHASAQLCSVVFSPDGSIDSQRAGEHAGEPPYNIMPHTIEELAG